MSNTLGREPQVSHQSLTLLYMKYKNFTKRKPICLVIYLSRKEKRTTRI